MRQQLLKLKEKKKKDREETRTEHMIEAASMYDNYWRKLRDWYLMNHPLCENHLRFSIYKPATCVHHKKIISSGLTTTDMKTLTYDPTNLQSLCRDCHLHMHQIANKRNLSYIDECTPYELIDY